MADIIIHKKDEAISDYDALLHVQVVIRQGKISKDGDCYCHVSQFKDGIIVYAEKKKADVFSVVRWADNG